jgi:molybdenum cofactor cytidylyltransferase
MTIEKNNKDKKISSILLCAGKSSRMGQEKALLQVGNGTVITRILNILAPISESIVIVVSKNYEVIKQHLIDSYLELDNVHFVVNENAEKGMFTSIKKGLSHATKDLPTLLHMNDQPFVPEEIYEELIECLDDEHQIFQPSTIVDGAPRAGHPIIFNTQFRDFVISQSDNSNLRDVIRQHASQRKYLEVDDKRILQNLNTLEDFDKYKNIEI